MSEQDRDRRSKEELAVHNRTMSRALVLLTLLVLAAVIAPAVAAAPAGAGRVLHINDTYVDPDLSEACGFPVLESDVGVLLFTPSRNGFAVSINVRQTLTNLSTGQSIVVQTTGQQSFALDFDRSFTSGVYTETFSGLNFVIFTDDGVFVSSGHGVAEIAFIVENGRLVAISFEERATPNLVHATTSLVPLICAALSTPV